MVSAVGTVFENLPKFAECVEKKRFPDLDSGKLIGRWSRGCDRYDSGGVSACRTDKM